MGPDDSQTLCSMPAFAEDALAYSLPGRTAGKSWAGATLCCSYHLGGGMMVPQPVCTGVSANNNPVLGTD